jgi:hypothetical protein
MKPLVLPQVSLNGTSYTVLVEQQIAVMNALDALYAAMNEAAPNGRDYQHRPAEFAPAREAWDERMLVVHNMHKEIEAHALAIHDSK